MEDTKNQATEGGRTCSCGMGCACNGGFRRGHGIGILLRLLIGLIILIAVFAIGVKVGEFKAAFRSSWGVGGYGMMIRNGYGGYDASGLTGGGVAVPVGLTTATATSTAPAK